MDPKTGNSIYHYMDHCVRSMVILGMEYEMNERRIDELMKQAGAVEGYGGTDCMDVKKFAELIIRECADIATNRYQRLMDGGKAIKEHFGIK